MKKNWNIGQKISFFIDSVSGLMATGKVIDVYEMSRSENIYEVDSDFGVMLLKSDGNRL